MLSRYHVFDGGGLFGVVHACSSEDAVERACRMTDGHDPANCLAVAAVQRDRHVATMTTAPAGCQLLLLATAVVTLPSPTDDPSPRPQRLRFGGRWSPCIERCD